MGGTHVCVDSSQTVLEHHRSFHPITCTLYSRRAEIERNLVAHNIQTLDHWKLFNTLFPLTVTGKGQLSQSESLMYRYK